MFCRKCGKSIPEDSLFCSYCGEVVRSEDSSSENSLRPIRDSQTHGFCSNCGSSLPNGKLTGLCENCISNLGIETAEYGRCEVCGKALTENDGVICSSCMRVRTKYGSSSQITQAPKQSKRQKQHNTLIVFLCVLLIFGIFVALATSGGSLSSSTSAQTPSPTSKSGTASSASQPSAPEVKSDLELLTYDGALDSSINAIHITGKIKNNSGKTLSYVQIQFALYDKSGSQVGTALANTNGLESGNTWSYDAIGMAENISTFKAINLSGY